MTSVSKNVHYHVNHINVKVGGTIPTGNYANLQINVEWEVELPPGVNNPQEATQTIFNDIRTEIVKAVVPIAQAKERAAIRSLKGVSAEQQKSILDQIGTSQWLKTVFPATALGDTDNQADSPENDADTESPDDHYLDMPDDYNLPNGS